ncbi:MAG: N-6 DNA methylase [Bacteroidota bacterium]
MSQSKYYNAYKEFQDTMNMLGRRYDLARVFDDFLSLVICSFHRTNIQSKLKQKDVDNEELYLIIIKKYDRKAIDLFPKLLGALELSVYNKHYSDLLGDYFTQYITRGQNGQFFTPEPICELMAQLNMSDITKDKRVYDPASGSGRTLLSFAKHAPDNYFFANDVSSTCAKMTTLNFFLNGLRGEVAWMNTLSLEWYSAWQVNCQGIGILPVSKESSILYHEKPKIKQERHNKEQLTLF